MWIFQAEEKAMEETDPEEINAYISMLGKYIGRLKEEIEKNNGRIEKRNCRFNE